VFQSISSRFPEGERKKGMIGERKNIQTTPNPHLLQAQKGPCPTIIQITAPALGTITESQGELRSAK
ncbi:MAG: hypothetical protein AB2693_22540, partial [Candidatus Thiodiazotropha sp.]